MTVKELMEKLAEFPPDMVVSSEGANFNGSDVETGCNIVVQEKKYRYTRNATCHIYHDSSDAF